MNAATGTSDATEAWEADPDEDAGLGEAPCLVWVALYLVDLNWGGPQDGDWFYDAGELVTDPDLYARLGVSPAAFLTDAEAGAHAARMSHHLDALNEGRPPEHSVLSQGVYEVNVLEAPVLPRHWPETAPRYE